MAPPKNINKPYRRDTLKTPQKKTNTKKRETTEKKKTKNYA